MPKVAVLAKMTAKEGQGAALAQIMRDKLFAAVQDERGTEIYSMYHDASNADVLWFFELYTDQDALTAHSQSDAMKSVGPELGPLLAGRPELMFLNPIVAKGIGLS
jgi:quinol monooxygenase YgiN